MLRGRAPRGSLSAALPRHVDYSDLVYTAEDGVERRVLDGAPIEVAATATAHLWTWDAASPAAPADVAGPAVRVHGLEETRSEVEALLGRR
jgi:hypothetical protein